MDFSMISLIVLFFIFFIVLAYMSFDLVCNGLCKRYLWAAKIYIRKYDSEAWGHYLNMIKNPDKVIVTNLYDYCSLGNSGIEKDTYYMIIDKLNDTLKSDPNGESFRMVDYNGKCVICDFSPVFTDNLIKEILGHKHNEIK